MNEVANGLIPAQPAPPAPPRRWNASRIAGTALMAFWICAALGLVAYLHSAWDLPKIEKYGPKLLSGLLVTVTLVGTSIIAGAIISLPVALGRLSKNPVLRKLAFAYVYVFRGTPLLAQLYLIYFGLSSFRPELETIGLWSFFRDAWNCAFFAFTLNTAAYQAEILRGAIESVPRGQWEAAKALGLNRVLTFRKIILPQALIVALRPYGNEIILMIKGSAIVALVSVLDLMGETRRAYSRTYDFQVYLWAALFYFVMVEALRNVWNGLEARLTRHLKR